MYMCRYMKIYKYMHVCMKKSCTNFQDIINSKILYSFNAMNFTDPLF